MCIYTFIDVFKSIRNVYYYLFIFTIKEKANKYQASASLWFHCGYILCICIFRFKMIKCILLDFGGLFKISYFSSKKTIEKYVIVYSLKSIFIKKFSEIMYLKSLCIKHNKNEIHDILFYYSLTLLVFIYIFKCEFEIFKNTILITPYNIICNNVLLKTFKSFF